MNIPKKIQQYAPQCGQDAWSDEDRLYLGPFFSDIDAPVMTIHNLPPEIVGALCSRASRAKGSLARVFLEEYIYPISRGDDQALREELLYTVQFLREHGFKNILNNQRAQRFYARWLGQFGDDSIAQQTGTHLTFKGISQVAMKFLEDQRIGLEPIEKSTRYVNFGEKINGRYQYYEPTPDLEELGTITFQDYRTTLDGLFETYNRLLPRVLEWLKKNYDAKELVLEKKAFDVLRGLLPMATLGQVAFRGNAQAFEYMINRTMCHELGELRWIAHASKQELDADIPSLLLRVEEDKVKNYQRYLSERKPKTATEAHVRVLPGLFHDESLEKRREGTKLVDYDNFLEEKIIAGILYSLPGVHRSFRALLSAAGRMRIHEKRAILKEYLGGRLERWYKPGRALENGMMIFEIVTNIGAFRDLHRHRMLTQDRQYFSVHHGYHVPQEIIDSGCEVEFRLAIESIEPLFHRLEELRGSELAQYAVCLAHLIPFYQQMNVRELFHICELRSGSQGHTDYRRIVQSMYSQFKEKFPAIAKYMQVDMNQYDLARRGAEERALAKEERILEGLKKSSPDTTKNNE